MKSEKKPFIHFYPGDHNGDPGIKEISALSEFVWLKMQFIMSQCVPYGRFEINGVGIAPATLARDCKLKVSEVVACIGELLKRNVASKDKNTGIIFSRRMVRDQDYRDKARRFGKHGGNPQLKNPPATAPTRSAATNGHKSHSATLRWNNAEYFPSHLEKILNEKSLQLKAVSSVGGGLNITNRGPPVGTLRAQISEIRSVLYGEQPSKETVKETRNSKNPKNYSPSPTSVPLKGEKLRARIAELKELERKILDAHGEGADIYWDSIGNMNSVGVKCLKWTQQDLREREADLIKEGKTA